MPRGQKSKLRAREKRHQKRVETQSLKSAQASTGEEEEAPCCSSSILGDAPSSSSGAGPLQASLSAPAITSVAAGASYEKSVKAKGHVSKSKNTSRVSTSTKSCGLNILSQKADKVVEYLLNQYKMKEPIKKSDMLKIVHKWYRKDFSEILRKVTEHMDLVYGLELKEVKPNSNFYTLVYNEDDTSDGSLSRGWQFPIKGILTPLLSMILLNDHCAYEEEVWEFLNMRGIYEGQSHFLFGEPRKLITQDLVQEQYLVYQQVPDSDPPRYEFLWGPRAYAECNKMKIPEFLAKLNESDPTVFQCFYEESLEDEEEQAQARVLI